MKQHLHTLFFSLTLLSVPAMGQEVPARKTIKLPNDRAADIPKGPYTDSWESIRQNYKTPEWFINGKFGIFIHWGVYSVPAAGSEWYPRHMYGAMLKHHTEKWGDPKDFGYKDFIPLFKAEKFNPDEWAELFKESGAKYVIPTAEHHDGFAMYDSKLTRWDAKDMGPERDIIGELAVAVRKRDIKFGVSNHRMENWDFMYPTAAKESDLFDPEYADLYGPPQKPDSSKASAMGPTQEEVMENKEAPQDQAFLEEWLARCQEIIDNYRPDILWFDNGINSRTLDPVKLRLAAYYYNRAHKWGKDVSLSTKHEAYLYGTIKDYERQGRAPKEKTTEYWQVDEPIGHKFGYVENLQLQSSKQVIVKLIENISKNGNLCLNISPKADGTIPDDQVRVLKEVGKWMKVNADAVYDTRAWIYYGEGPKMENKSDNNIRFTQKGNRIYAFILDSKTDLNIKSLNLVNVGKVKKVNLLGSKEKIKFEQDKSGLKTNLPISNPDKDILVLEIVI